LSVTAGPVASRVLVWPRWQRLLHAGLGSAVLVCLWTFEGGVVHEAAGYAAAALALVRLALGLWGPPAARFSAFLRGPRATLAYGCALVRGQAARHLNHNPLGAWMVLMLLLMAATAGVSGALYVTDRFWGEAWVIATHAASAWPLAFLVPAHLAGVWHASRVHRENLVAAMWHGRKRPLDGVVTSD
jgi:cytochrome b